MPIFLVRAHWYMAVVRAADSYEAVAMTKDPGGGLMGWYDHADPGDVTVAELSNEGEPRILSEIKS